MEYVFARGEHNPRPGPAHSSDRAGLFKDLWKIRKALGINPEHSGSVDIWDHFGTKPYNDNEVKQARREVFRYVLRPLLSLPGQLAEEARKLWRAFDEADRNLDDLG